MDVSEPLATRFWAKVYKTENCWFWLVATVNTENGHYGAIGLGTRDEGTEYAHRVSWRLHFGTIPDGKIVMHKCDTPACVRPDHLILGTHKENAEDRTLKGRTTITGGRNGGKGRMAI